MSIVSKTKGNGATSSRWLRKISQHRVHSMAQQCSKGVGGPMGDQQ